MLILKQSFVPNPQCLQHDVPQRPSFLVIHISSLVSLVETIQHFISKTPNTSQVLRSPTSRTIFTHSYSPFFLPSLSGIPRVTSRSFLQIREKPPVPAALRSRKSADSVYRPRKYIKTARIKHPKDGLIWTLLVP